MISYSKHLIPVLSRIKKKLKFQIQMETRIILKKFKRNLGQRKIKILPQVFIQGNQEVPPLLRRKSTTLDLE